MVEHVSDLKLQYLVELSKLGDRCAVMESEVAQWLVEPASSTASGRSRS